MAGVNEPKLTPNLLPKHKYVLHYRALQLYVRLGLQVTAIHGALKFKQGPLMKSYIALNAEKRVQATSKVEKSFYKVSMSPQVFFYVCVCVY